MLEYLLEKFEKYKKTRPINNLEDMCVTFIRSIDYIHYLEQTDKNVLVIAPKNMERSLSLLPENIKFYVVDDPDYVFTIYHNELYKDKKRPENVIGKNCVIHDTVLMDVDGLKVMTAPNNDRVQFKHTGNVIIEDNVEVGPYTVIHRGALSPTIIKRGVKIGAKNNIAHNNYIGENSVFAVGIITNGSVKIGRNCWIASGVLIRNGVSICDNVMIGLGSVVIKDITVPGVYIGSPCRFLRPYDEKDFTYGTGPTRSKNS